MTTGQLIVIAIAIFLASGVYAIAGFGFALLAMPIMTIAVPVERAVVVMSVLAILSTWSQAIALRRQADRGLATRLALGAFAGMPLGLVALNVIDDRTLRILLGVSVLLATAQLIRNVSLVHVGPGLDYSLGFASGVLNTSIGTNGPPIVFDLQSRRLEPDPFRATVAVTFAASNVVGMTLFLLDGKVTADGLQAAALALPAWALGLAIGVRVRPRVPATHFRRLVIALLLATSLTTIAIALA